VRGLTNAIALFKHMFTTKLLQKWMRWRSRTVVLKEAAANAMRRVAGDTRAIIAAEEGENANGKNAGEG